MRQKIAATLSLSAGFKLTLILLMLFISNLSFTQVRIKEKVVINPQTHKPSFKLSTLPPTSYVAEYTGSCLGKIFLEAKHNSPSGTISITTHDTNFVYNTSDYISNEENRTFYYSNCDKIWLSYLAYYVNLYGTNLGFKIPNIHIGDTLNFSYNNCIETPVRTRFHTVEFSKRDSSCFTYEDGTLQELVYCGIDIEPLRFFISQDADTIRTLSTTTLYVNAGSGFIDLYGNGLNDSLITLEIDSAQYAKFIRIGDTKTDTLDSPLDSVKYSDAYNGKIKLLAIGSTLKDSVCIAISARLMTDPMKIFDDTVTIKDADILLGRTKYYQARVDENYNLCIEEVSNPILEGGLSGTSWQVDPYSKLGDGKKYGKRLGVYWEKEKPIDGTTSTQPAGLIRLIGRYWTQDSTYKVKLTASYSGKTSSINIDVKKPKKLGNSDTTAVDCFGHTINLDSIIIKYAGENGIPPQLIKGQIFKESLPKFTPSYRYEPWQDIKIQDSTDLNEQYFGGDKNFVITKTTMGNGPAIPSTHTYVPPVDGYIRSPMTIRSYLAAHPDQYINSKTRTFMHDDEITKKWQDIYAQVVRDHPNLNSSVNTSRSFSMTMDTLRLGFIGRKEYDYMAQTRIVASYGFLQMTFYDAATWGYFGFTKTSTIQPPEYLSDVSYELPAYAERMYQNKKAKAKVWSGLSISNWPAGYEKTWIAALNWYNHGEPNYEYDVMDNAKNYLPSKGN